MPSPRDLDPNQRVIYAVGAFVLCTQELERFLKFIVPFTSSDAADLSSVTGRHLALSRKTLGFIAGKFSEAMTDGTVEMQAHIKQIVDERNQVVHHFAEHFKDTLSRGAHDEVLDSLRGRHERALHLLQTLRMLALELMKTLRDSVYRGTEEYADFADLCESLRTSVVNMAMDPKCGRSSG
jgi:hypothetical protein